VEVKGRADVDAAGWLGVLSPTVEEGARVTVEDVDDGKETTELTGREGNRLSSGF
jgi:hypothetical protein